MVAYNRDRHGDDSEKAEHNRKAKGHLGKELHSECNELAIGFNGCQEDVQ